MRSSARWWARQVAPVLLLAHLLMLAPMQLQAAEPTPGPTRAQVEAEVATLRADPDIAGTRKEKTLRFKPSKPVKKPKPDAPSDIAEWLRQFSQWMTEAGRVAIWVLGALAFALFVVGLRHWIRARAGAVKGPGRLLPSHVHELDIRPESLPDKVGAAAAALWQRGEHRAALSLLYRGALSRLVHDYEVPIRAASTEGECVALAAARLPAERSAFFGRLVRAWQLTVYGAHMPDSASVLALCADFDAGLGTPSHAAPATLGGATAS